MPRPSDNGTQLVFPAAGLDKSLAYQSQPPYTSPDLLNVRPYDVIEDRLRGGSRPGMNKYAQTQLGSGSPINMLVDLHVTDDSKYRNWVDYFEGSELGAVWHTATWMTNPVTIYPGDGAELEYLETGGNYRDAITNLDTAEEYTVEIYISPYNGAFHGKYQIYARLDAAPAPTTTGDGVIAELITTGAAGVYSGTLTEYNSGTPTAYNFTGGTLANAQADSGWFSMTISGNDITCKWNGNTLISAQAVTAHSGVKVGFGMECTVEGGACIVDFFRVRYFRTDNDVSKRTYLIAASNGNLYRDNDTGGMTQIFSTPPLASDYPIFARQRAGKIYIADWEPWKRKDEDNNGTVAADGTTFDDAAVSDWTTLGINTDGDVIILSSPTGNITAGTYKISAVVAGSITLASDARTDTTSDTGGTVSYRIGKAPKVYDPDAATLSILTATANKGVVPTGCQLIALYRDRICFASNIEDPYNWYMSRSGDPLDWDNLPNNPTDAQRAVDGNNSQAGLVGQPVTALMPDGDDYMIFGAVNSLWAMDGDPADAGIIYEISENIGVLSGAAYTYKENGELIFLDTTGLYRLNHGQRIPPEPLSERSLPQEFKLIDPKQQFVTVQWNERFKGIHIFITDREKKENLSYWWDARVNAFFPDTFNEDRRTYSAVSHTGIGADRKVVLGCYDGYIRYFDPKRIDDDGETFSSYVTYGPIMLGKSGGHEGILNEIFCVLGENSGAVNWEVLTSESAQKLRNQTALHSGTFTKGANYSVRPNARGRAALIKLTGDGFAWAIESLQIWRSIAGRYKKN